MRLLPRGLRARSATAFALSALVLSITLSVVTYQLGRWFLLDQREDLATRQVVVNALVVKGLVAAGDTAAAAVAVAEAEGAEVGLSLLEGLAAGLPRSHRLPAIRAELLMRAGRNDEARAAYDLAISLCANDAERAHLTARRAVLA